MTPARCRLSGNWVTLKFSRTLRWRKQQHNWVRRKQVRRRLAIPQKENDESVGTDRRMKTIGRMFRRNNKTLIESGVG